MEVDYDDDNSTMSWPFIISANPSSNKIMNKKKPETISINSRKRKPLSPKYNSPSSILSPTAAAAPPTEEERPPAATQKPISGVRPRLVFIVFYVLLHTWALILVTGVIILAI